MLVTGLKKQMMNMTNEKVIHVKLKPKMANGWKTADQIRQAYGFKKTYFYYLKIKCLESAYADAIIQPTRSLTYIDENRWQEFMRSLSNEYLEKKYGV